jgi:hypothetical protein
MSGLLSRLSLLDWASRRQAMSRRFAEDPQRLAEIMIERPVVSREELTTMVEHQRSVERPLTRTSSLRLAAVLAIPAATGP